jgi:hypothetical protein
VQFAGAKQDTAVRTPDCFVSLLSEATRVPEPHAVATARHVSVAARQDPLLTAAPGLSISVSVIVARSHL